MSGIHLILIFTGLFGMLPLCIILYKKRRTNKIIKRGMMVKARIYRVSGSPKYGDTISYCFYDEQQQLAYGSLHCKQGLYKINDVIDVYFLPGNPKRSTVQGAWKSPVLVISGIVIAIFTWFAVYKLFEMVNKGEL